MKSKSYPGAGHAYCRLCQRWQPIDDMAVMAYSRLHASPPCCAACWARLIDAAARMASEEQPASG